MDVDRDIDAAVVAKATEAVGRWRTRSKVRKQRTEALESGRPMRADTPDRLALRVNRLVDDVRAASRDSAPPSNPTLKSLVERSTPLTAAELSDDIVNEVVLGARNFLSIEFFERGLLAARTVGCVVINRSGAFRARGTGFLVAPGLMLTNEHVLTSKQVAAQCAFEMDYEQNHFGPAKQPQFFALEPDRFFLNHADLDFALVAVAPTSELGVSLASYGWQPLNKAQGKISISDKDFVNIIQHPAGREKEVVIRDNRVLDMRTGDEEGSVDLGGFLHYETDTEKGSSGSPVCNDGWEVVALHHSGVPATDKNGNWLDKDGGIWVEGQQPVDRIQWVANEAVRVSAVVAAVSMAQVAAHERQLHETFLAAQPPQVATRPSDNENIEEPVRPPRRTRAPAAADRAAPTQRRETTRTPANGGYSVSMEVPLRITITLGDAATATSMSAGGGISPRRNTLLTEAIEAEELVDRDGYNPDFLGVAVPLPTMKPDPRFGGLLTIPRPARPEDTTELRYHHYSVLMSAGRRLAYVSASNLDFDAPETASREDGRDTWWLDPRIDSRDQLGARFYSNNDYDRGHLTRRDDTAWGNTLAAAIAANDDTFFYPNAAPQHFLFNQSDEFTGADLKLWGDLENHISAQGLAQRAKLTILNGPVFGNNDKRLRGALVPLKFYKIVIWRDEGQDPGAVGFLLDQTDMVSTLPEEAIDAGPFEIRQQRIADIEAELDISFGIVKDWDRLAAVDPDEAIDTDGVLIASVADIKL